MLMLSRTGLCGNVSGRTYAFGKTFLKVMERFFFSAGAVVCLAVLLEALTSAVCWHYYRKTFLLILKVPVKMNVIYEISKFQQQMSAYTPLIVHA